MNFRECVLDCIAQGEVVQSFNRLHAAAMPADLLARLQTTHDGQNGGQVPLAELDAEQQELLACFILFVHRHVWRKVKLAQSRVTRVSVDHSMLLDISALEQVNDRQRALHG